MKIIPLIEIAALGVEDLNAVVLTVGHVHRAVGVRDHVMGYIEATGISAWLAPGKKVPPRGVEFVDLRISVAVRNIDFPGMRT